MQSVKVPHGEISKLVGTNFDSSAFQQVLILLHKDSLGKSGLFIHWIDQVRA